MGLIKEVRERRLIPFMGAYLVTGFVALEGVDQLISHEILPAVAYPIALVLYVFGVLGSLTFAWYHGEKGRQETTRGEVFIHATLFVFALATSAYVARSTLAAEERERMRLAGLEQLSPTEDPRRIAVMYFEDRSPDGELTYLADGLTETLIDELSQIDALNVVSKNGSQLFRGADASLDSISNTLQIGTLVQGTVAASEEGYRVTVQMVDPSSGEQVGSRRLERPQDELLDLLDDISRELSLFLRERVGEEIGMLQVASGTASTAAWETVQRAQQIADDAQALGASGEFEPASAELVRADSLLQQAEGMDEEWVRPIADRGWLGFYQARLGGFDRSHYADWIERGLQHANRALLMAPDDASARELRGSLRYFQYLFNLAPNPEEAETLRDDAEADLRTAVEADPGRATAWAALAHLSANKGDVAGAKLAALRSYEADKYLESANLTVWRLFITSLDLQDDIEAERWCEEGRRRFPEDFRFAECLIMVMVLPGQEPDIEEAWQLLDRYVELSPEQVKEFNQADGQMWLAMVLARAGLADSARAVARRARPGPEIDPVRELAYTEAVVQTWLGDYEEALRLLGLYLAANPTETESLANDQTWYLEDLRAQPGFRSLVGQSGE
jgi:TolB-like protein